MGKGPHPEYPPFLICEEISMFQGKKFHDCEVKKKECVVCGFSFKPFSGVHKFCSPECKGKWKYITGTHCTENQYKEISGNWKRYLARLKYVGGEKRKDLTVKILLDVLKKQNYKCALSGVGLTCLLKKGMSFKTNCSIDRINAGEPYTVDNIQLVCKAVNSFRNNLSIKDYISWCHKVAETHPQEGI